MENTRTKSINVRGVPYHLWRTLHLKASKLDVSLKDLVMEAFKDTAEPFPEVNEAKGDVVQFKGEIRKDLAERLNTLVHNRLMFDKVKAAPKNAVINAALEMYLDKVDKLTLKKDLDNWGFNDEILWKGQFE